MLRIGFATQFYTLWDVNSENIYSTDAYGNHWLSAQKTNYCFIKNVSTDLNKVRELYPDLEIDEDLKGKNRSWESFQTFKPTYHYSRFPYGKLAGTQIQGCSDTWQLNRLFQDSSANARSRVIARRILIELGFIVREDNTWMLASSVEQYRKRRSLDLLQKGHHFTDGSKVELTIKRIDSFSFSTDFGLTFVDIYASECGRLFKYVGSNPPEINNEFVSVKATVKHSVYNGEMETRLQRIKVLTPKVA